MCLHSMLDEDGDGYAPQSCGGYDCNDRNASVNLGATEYCGDGSDNDCNGVADCFDPVCESNPTCGCIASPEVCDNGRDDDCDGTVDCLDGDCDGTPTCGCRANEVGACGNGSDDDCDGALDCDDSDCAAFAPCNCGSIEDCSNGVDDDCNGIIDCADPRCGWIYPCVCAPPGQPESCTNGADDDCDGLSDCADPDCILSPTCTHCSAEVCNDSADNDCDGMLDCADSSCFLDPACPIRAEECNNGRDDDFDGRIDCFDPDCSNNPSCLEQQSSCLTARVITSSGTWTGSTYGLVGQHSSPRCGGEGGEAVFKLVLSVPSRVRVDAFGTSFDSVIYVRQGSCDSGAERGCDDDEVDWDGLLEFPLLEPGTYFIFLDGLMVDPVWGPNEGSYVLNVELTPNPPELCTNRADDDGDWLADCADPDCTMTADCAGCRGGLDATPELGAWACTDGTDNDCDGLIDCADDDCKANAGYDGECCDGADENGNGIPDDFNCRCVSDDDCPSGQACYAHTLHACGSTCDSYVGDVCPIEVPGSACSNVTGQCEF